MLRRFSWLWVWMLVLFVSVGCAGVTPTPGDPTPSEGSASETTKPESTHSTQYPVTVIDDMDREVTIPSRPTRVVSFAPSNTELLYYVGAAEQVVGVDDFTEWPEDLATLSRVGGILNPNYEQIVALETELVLTIAGTDEMNARLEELGICVIVLQPDDFDGIYDNLRLVGLMMDRQDEAEQVIEEMQRVMEEVASVVQEMALEQRPTVLFEGWPDPLMTTGPNTFTDYLIQQAGGVNVAQDVPGEWVEYSLDKLLDKDPDVIVTTFHDTMTDLEQGNRPYWDQLTAVQEGRYYWVDMDLVTHPSPRMMEGLRELFTILHPSLSE